MKTKLSFSSVLGGPCKMATILFVRECNSASACHLTIIDLRFFGSRTRTGLGNTLGTSVLYSPKRLCSRCRASISVEWRSTGACYKKLRELQIKSKLTSVPMCLNTFSISRRERFRSVLNTIPFLGPSGRFSHSSAVACD